jgi:hypothetical protein
MGGSTHYVCDECAGVSDVAKACSTEGCSKNGQPLSECNCDMPEHKEKVEASKKEKENGNDA